MWILNLEHEVALSNSTSYLVKVSLYNNNNVRKSKQTSKKQLHMWNLNPRIQAFLRKSYMKYG